LELYINDKDYRNQSVIHGLSLRLILNGFLPVLICRDRSFSFESYFRFARKFRIPLSISGQALFVTPLNMYHVKNILTQIRDTEANERLVPVFMDFSYHYLDEGISPAEREYLFQRDFHFLHHLRASREGLLLFYERGALVRSHSKSQGQEELHSSFRKKMELRSSVCLELENKQSFMKKNTGDPHGFTDSNLFDIYSKFIARMASLSSGSSARIPQPV
jgi:hypothetical protein